MAGLKHPTIEATAKDILGDDVEIRELHSTINDCDKLIRVLRDLKYELLWNMLEAAEKIDNYRMRTEKGIWEPNVLFHRQVTYRLKMILMREREKNIMSTVRIYEKWITQYSTERDAALIKKLEMIRRRERLAWDAVFGQAMQTKKH